MAVLRHRALALFLVCLVFTLLCLALLPPSRSRSAVIGRHTSPQAILTSDWSRNQALHNLVLETHQKLSNVIQSADLQGVTSNMSAEHSTYTRVAQIKKVIVLMTYFLLSDH